MQVSGRHATVSQQVLDDEIRPGTTLFLNGRKYSKYTCDRAIHKQRIGGYISGPTQFALADVAMWIAVFGAKGFNEMAMTSELSIRYDNAFKSPCIYEK